MSTTNLEKDTARFKELLAIGFEKLDAAQKEEYSVLLEVHPEFTDLILDEDEEVTNPEVKSEEKSEEKSEDKSKKGTAKSAPKGSKKEDKREYRSYFMTSNVIHDGKPYEKDQEVSLEDPNLQLFLKKGFLIKR